MKVQIMERKTWEKVSRTTKMENSMTYVLNRYLVMDDFTVETIFTQPLAGNELLRRLRFQVSLDEM
jgi:dihydrofolate reductase